jgi:hypothetical protein
MPTIGTSPFSRLGTAHENVDTAAVPSLILPLTARTVASRRLASSVLA